MHFTVVFSGAEGHDLSFGLVFIPSPCWVRGDDVVLNLNPRTPELEPGFVARLLDTTGVRDEVLASGRRCTVVVHAGGHGVSAHLAMLVEELERESLAVVVTPPQLGIRT